MSNKILVTFDSHFDGIFCTKILRQTGVSFYTMPIPRMLSASCGICVVINSTKGLKAIKEQDVKYKGIYEVLDGDYKPLA